MLDCLRRSGVVYCVLVTFDDRSDRIDHGGPDLLWQQVRDDLEADIDSGVLAPGWKLPSELDLAERYGVGRVTARRAIAELAAAGKLTVVHGRGTFVARQRDE